MGLSSPIAHTDTIISHKDTAEKKNEQSNEQAKQQHDLQKQYLPQQWSSFTELLQSDKSEDFTVFKLNQGYSKYGIGLCVIQTLLITWFTFLNFHGDGVPIPTKVLMIMRLFVPPMLWSYFYLLSQYEHSDVFSAAGKRIVLLGNTILLFQSFFAGSLMLSWVITFNDCQSDACLQDHPKNSLPIGAFVNLIVLAIVDPIFISCHDISVCFLSMAISVTSLLSSAVMLHLDFNELNTMIAMSIVIFCIVVNYEGNKLSVYTAFSQFEWMLRKKIESENKETIMKTQTEDMRNMIGNVAHDLRTPLQAFQSEMEVLSDNIRANSHDKESLFSSIKQLGRICNFMNMTINRSIDFTKASSGIKLNPSIESVNFSETLNWAVGCMVQQSNAKVPIVVLPIPKRIHNQLFTDKQWLMENMMCLLSNAQKFTTEGKITIRCSLDESLPGSAVIQTSNTLGLDSVKSKGTEDIENGSCVHDDSVTETVKMSSMLLIEVEDTGIGITKENQERLFKPFMQAQRRTGGTGLGLYALSKRLESLGGDCGVRDRSDGASGSCFWISIPFKPDEIEDAYGVPCTDVPRQDTCQGHSAPSIVTLMSGFIKNDKNEEDTSRHISLAEDIPRLQILLVDDSPFIQKTTSRALKKAGHHVEVAQHGAECLKILEGSQLSPCVFDFDLILMDLQMPVMDGLEATKRIRALEKSASSESSDCPHIMIIGVTANAEGEARADCIESGMDGFMEKPLKVVHLHEYINSKNWNSNSFLGGHGTRKM